MSSSTNKPEQKYKSVHTGSLAEEFAKNDDIVDYIQGSSLEKLIAKYGAAEEDASIRHSNIDSGEFAHATPSPVTPKEPKKDAIDTPIVAAPKSKFKTATSRYDNDSVLFGDIKLNEEAPKPVPAKALKEEEINPPAEEPQKKKRGRPPKVKLEEPQAPTAPKKRGRPPKNQPVAEQPAVEETTVDVVAVSEPSVEEPVAATTEKFNTNTRVIFVNEEIEDGIKRTDELEVSSAFIKEKPKKRKGLFRR